MYKARIISGGDVSDVYADCGCSLSELLNKNNIYMDHPCGGTGKCGKCIVNVNGRNVLSCRYTVQSDITVTVPVQHSIQSPSVESVGTVSGSDTFLAVDIGTTTVAAAVCLCSDGSAINSVTINNPQKMFGADVMSRIAYCTSNGPQELHNAIISCINNLINKLCGNKKSGDIFFAGNTTMLHLLMNADCSSMGVSPYTPVFLEGKSFPASEIGIDGDFNAYTLPCIDSFVGADITAGIAYVGKPSSEKYNLLVDLGTNAEIVLFSDDRILCTSAAAGPCFEGANISSGMSAVNGAVCSYRPDGSISVIGGIDPDGICATGLIDLIAVLLKKGVIDETGKMSCPEFEITESVHLTQEDIRQYQLAKSAVCSAIQVLVSKAGIDYSDIEKLYVAGGFSSAMNIDNAVNSGLFPAELKHIFTPVNNSSLKGTIQFAVSGKKICFSTSKAKYVGLSSDPEFADAFIDNMMFYC